MSKKERIEMVKAETRKASPGMIEFFSRPIDNVVQPLPGIELGFKKYGKVHNKPKDHNSSK